MPSCTIDGIKVEFRDGDNLVEAAKRAGISVPVFCYHPGLSVVAQCRMCAVDVEKMPKIQTACSTKAVEGMVVSTKTDRVKQARESVMEFLLVNHPLDCPICDKSGECDLQDHSYDHGSAYQRSTEERRTYVDLDMGPVIKKNMNRCIHCTRCIRFGDEVANIREMVAIHRGNNVDITTVDGKALETDYAGNYADICPTGSLTLKDFRFNKRVWYLKKTPTVCEGCSRGCNMEIHEERNQIYRCLPRENMEINRYWLCDEGRFNYKYIHHPDRVLSPQVQEGNSWAKKDWFETMASWKSGFRSKDAVFLVGTDLTQEELQLILHFAKSEMGGVPVFHFGTPNLPAANGDGDSDGLLKRKSKTSNLHGAEKLGIAPFQTLPAGKTQVVVFRGGRAELPRLDRSLKVTGFGVFLQEEIGQFSAVFPGASFAEKTGTVVNFQGKEQTLVRAILPVGESKLLSEALMLWKNQSLASGAA